MNGKLLFKKGYIDPDDIIRFMKKEKPYHYTSVDDENFYFYRNIFFIKFSKVISVKKNIFNPKYSYSIKDKIDCLHSLDNILKSSLFIDKNVAYEYTKPYNERKLGFIMPPHCYLGISQRRWNCYKKYIDFILEKQKDKLIKEGAKENEIKI